MIYECENCSAPLSPGIAACSRCGEAFAEPVPADAEVPRPGWKAQPVSPPPNAPPRWDAKQIVLGLIGGIVLGALLAGGIRSAHHAPATSPGDTPSAHPAASVPSAAPPWVTVATFAGNIDNPNRKTESFTVGPKWKIAWKTEAGQYGARGSLVVFINPLNGGDASGQAIAHYGGGSGTSLQYGAGEYYLQVLSNQHHVLRVMTQK